jgi:hypothetical protein
MLNVLWKSSLRSCVNLTSMTNFGFHFFGRTFLQKGDSHLKFNYRTDGVRVTGFLSFVFKYHNKYYYLSITPLKIKSSNISLNHCCMSFCSSNLGILECQTIMGWRCHASCLLILLYYAVFSRILMECSSD